MYQISIIIPIYNAEKYLKECLDSVIINKSNIEYILIDDGSTDKSLAICKQFKGKNVRIIKNKNHGVSYTRNYGKKIAKGKYIMFVDADDYLSNNWYNIVERELDKDYDLVIFSNNYKNTKFTKWDLKKACIGMTNSDIEKCSISSPFSRLYKLAFINHFDINFNEKLINGEDLLFNLEVISKSNNIKIINNGFYYYRINLNSATASYNPKFISSDYEFQKEIISVFSKETESRKEIKKICTFCTIKGLYLITQKLALTNSKEKVPLVKSIIDKDIYNESLQQFNDVKKEFTLFEKIIIHLLNKGRISLSILLFKMKNKIKRLNLSKNEVFKTKKI